MGTVPESVATEPGEVKPSLSGDSQLLLVQPQAQPQPNSLQLQPPLRLPGQQQPPVNLLHTLAQEAMGNQAVDHLRPRLCPTYWPNPLFP